MKHTTQLSFVLSGALAVMTLIFSGNPALSSLNAPGEANRPPDAANTLPEAVCACYMTSCEPGNWVCYAECEGSASSCATCIQQCCTSVGKLVCEGIITE